jgi:DNA-binding NtrC family response regulator
MARILIIDDDVVVRRAVELVLGREGRHAVRSAESPSEANRLQADWSPDLVILDLGFPGESGETWLADQRSRDRDFRVVVLSGYDDAATAVRLLRLGAADYLVKPVPTHHLRSVVERILGQPLLAATGTPHATALVWPIALPTLADCTQGLIGEALRRCDGSVAEAARILGITRQALSKRLARRRARAPDALDPAYPQPSPRSPAQIPARITNPPGTLL